ncbi:MAG: ABC transporter permease [Propionibacteriaceae bacterium]|nr:ABC transporter permease [Propionibacteriaceae bacterium]
MNTWSLSLQGLKTVLSLEVMQRLRSKKWKWALVAWALTIGAITMLVMWAVYQTFTFERTYNAPGRIQDTAAGPMAFSLIVMFIIGMGLVVAPAFTATSINGDRNAGTLATLQATGLSAVEIAAGKFIAAWLTAGGFLASAFPFIVVTMVFGNISVLRVIVCLVVLFLLIGVVCVIGLGWSALFNRTAASTVMTYLSVVVFAVISPILVGLSMPFIQEEDMPVREWGLTEAQMDEYLEKNALYWDEIWDEYSWDDHGDIILPLGTVDPTVLAPRPPVEECAWHETTTWVTHTESVWWLLAANPFVIVADAAPVMMRSYPDIFDIDDVLINDVLSGIRITVRELSRPPATEYDNCTWLYGDFPEYNAYQNADGSWTVKTLTGKPADVPLAPISQRPASQDMPLWPWGLGINLLMGGCFFWITVRRLRIPYRTLAPGTRVA